MLKLGSIILVGVFAILAVYLQRTIKIVGLFRSTKETGTCEALNVGFCEKIVEFDSKIYGFCSSFSKKAEYYPTLHLGSDPVNQQDSFYVYDGEIKLITVNFDKGLLVNGFEMKRIGKKVVVMATNVYNMTIEKFVLEKDALTHQKTIKSELFHALDDISIVDDNRVVVTNDHSVHAATNLFYRAIEDIFSLPNGNVLLITNDKVEIIIPHLPNANELLLKQEEVLQLWVTSPSEGTIFRYNFNPDEGDYSVIDKIALDFPPDNLSIGDKGQVYIAGMVKAHNLLPAILKWRSNDMDGYFKSDLRSQIVEIKNETSQAQFFGNLFSKKVLVQQTNLHFSTGAIQYKNGFIVSGFNALMYCTTK